MNIILKHFNELSNYQLYDVLQLREEVFEIEQDCIYPDIDNKDKEAYHLLIYQANKLVAYARLLDKEISYPEYSSIGRVCTKFSKRKNGIGKLLMQHAVQYCQELFPGTEIKISAQTYLLKFYEGFGFQVKGEEYLEDNIPHHAMIYKY